MRIYWYWPYIHPHFVAVPAAIPRAGDELLLHTLEQRLDVDAYETDGFRVEATLAPVADDQERSPRWAVGRAATYVRRVAQRRAVLRAGHFDICHIVFLNYFTDWFDLRRIARHENLVFEIHDVVPHQRRVPRGIERRLLAFAYNAPGAIVTRHAYVRDRLHDEFGIDRARVTVIPLPVDEIDRPPRTDPHDPPTVLFFGTFRRNKGVDVLLRAIEPAREIDARFVFAGRGFTDVEDLVRAAAGRDPRITAEIDYVTPERKHELYTQADLVVLPYTQFASTSAVLGDAYAYGVPVVATDVGALGASIREDGTGWIVATGDAAALADAIGRALGDRDAWRAAAAAAGTVAADRTPSAIARRYRDLYDRISRDQNRK